MSKIKGLSFYKTDKDIFDQLHQRTPSKASILEHLKQRGLLISHEEEKEELAEMISPWFTSYFDQKFIVGELGGETRKKSIIQQRLCLITIHKTSNPFLKT